MITHRSKAVQYQRCGRMRWWLGEAEEGGLEPLRRGSPLVTGGAVHAGLATLLLGQNNREDVVLLNTKREFSERVEEHGLSDSPELSEQEAMAEALVRVAGLRILPRLLEDYEVLEVERPDSFTLAPGIEFPYTPDAILRNRMSGDLFVLSWKTAAAQPREEEVRVDLQGVTEAWGVQARLQRIKEGKVPAPDWYRPGDERVVGVQMGYLIKGRRSEIERGGFVWKKFDSPLVWGWTNHKDPKAPRVPEFHWKCVEPHPIRKGKYHPEGICQGGRKHERPGEWKLSQILPSEVEEWISSLPIEILDRSWALPSPIFREPRQMERYMNQLVTQERRIQIGKRRISLLQDAIKKEPSPDIKESLEKSLEMEMDYTFPQNGTAVGCKFFGRLCDAYELCFGPAHVGRDPLGSGNFKKREQLYQIEEAV